jgi:hypothetical protein
MLSNLPDQHISHLAQKYIPFIYTASATWKNLKFGLHKCTMFIDKLAGR